MSFFKKLVDPAGLTSGRGSKAFTDPANVRGRGARGLVDPAGIFGGGGGPKGRLPPGGIPAWQQGVKGAGVNPAAAQNPMNRAPAQAQGGLGGGRGLGGMVRQAVQNQQQRRTAAPAAVAPPAMSLGGGQPGAGIRVYSDGGKVYNRKPNGKGC